MRQTDSGAWECVVPPDSSYQGFLSRSKTVRDNFCRQGVPVPELLQVAEELAQTNVCLVAADIPLSRLAITGRRTADNEVSRVFGSRKCSTHSPSSLRPGALSDQMRADFHRCGFELATTRCEVSNRSLIEVYPHTAMLSLMESVDRVPYKVSKTRKYWPDDLAHIRVCKIIEILSNIQQRLSLFIGGIEIENFKSAKSLSDLKQVEDKLDSLACAWVGILALEGKATPLGDSNAAIWVPDDSLSAVKPTSLYEVLGSGPFASPEFMANVEDLPLQERDRLQSA